MGNAELGATIQTFWGAFNDLQTKKQGPSCIFACIWKASEIKEGNCHLRHKRWSVTFTIVFGKSGKSGLLKALGVWTFRAQLGCLEASQVWDAMHLSSEKKKSKQLFMGHPVLTEWEPKTLRTALHCVIWWVWTWLSKWGLQIGVEILVIYLHVLHQSFFSKRGLRIGSGNVFATTTHCRRQNY